MTVPTESIDPLTLQPEQKTVAIALSVVVALFVLELIRRRKLREEQSTLWLGTAVLLVILAIFDSLLSSFASLIGAKTAPSALFFGALLFLMLVALQFSIRLSKLTYRNRKLGQRVALLEQRLDELSGSGRVGGSGATDGSDA